MKNFKWTAFARWTIAAALCAVGMAQAQQVTTYPNRPVTVVMAGGAGGSFDTLLRFVLERVNVQSPHPFVVQNVPGASGLAATSRVVTAKPDGSMILGGYFLTLAGNQRLFKLDYDPVTALDPIVLIGSLNYALLVRADSPYKSMDDLIKAARAAPGRTSYASSGIGTGAHIGGELIKAASNVDIIHVPYPAAAASLTAVLAGTVDWNFEGMVTALPQIRAGKVRALAVSSKKRFPLLPEVPTVEELGYKGFDVGGWLGLVAPAGSPPQVTTFLNTQINRVLKLPETREFFLERGADILGGTPADFSATIKAEVDRYSAVLKNVNLKPPQ